MVCGENGGGGGAKKEATWGQVQVGHGLGSQTSLLTHTLASPH